MAMGPIHVWYLRGQEGLARQVGIWSADAYREITGLLEFQPEGVFTVRLHPSPYAWGQQPAWIAQGSLTPPSRFIEVYPASTRAATAALVRSHTIAAVLHHLYFSDGVRLQNRSLLYMPDWFLWGFAYFWGEGWQGEDLARLQSLPDKPILSLTERTAKPSPLYRSLYKAIWFYLYRTYGQRKVIDLLYMTRLTRNISEALSLTLNLTEEELTEKWRAFLSQIQIEPTEAEEILSGQAVLSAAAASDDQSFAYATYQKGFIRYFLYLQGTKYSLPGQWPWPVSYVEPEVSLAFAPEGRLAWTAYEADGPVLWVWIPQERAYKRYVIGLRSIQSIAWESESLLWLSGINDEGESALYVLTLPQGSLRKVHSTQGDLLWPLPQKETVWAIWQPDTSGLAPLSVLWESARPGFYQAGQWEALPFPPYYSAGGGWIIADTLQLTLCDVYGQGWPWLFSPDTHHAAKWGVAGLHRWIGHSPTYAYFLRYRGGRLRMGKVPKTLLLQPSAAFPPLAAAEIVQLRLQRRAAYGVAYRGLSTPSPSPLEKTVPDTPRAERQPFYLFDEEPTRPVRRRRRPTTDPPSESRVATFPSAKPLGKTPHHFLLWDLRMNPVLHPLMRLGWQITAITRDLNGDHELRFSWTPYINLRSSELHIGYSRQRGAWQPFVELRQQTHFFPAQRYNRTLRNTTWQSLAGMRWRLSPTVTIEGSLVGIEALRYDMQTTDAQDLSGQARWLGGRLRSYYQDIEYREVLPWRGWQASMWVEGYRREGKWGFPLAYFQVGRFQPVGRFLTLHLKGHAAAGGSQGRYFLLGGVPDWINYTFLNRSQIPPLNPIGAYYLAEYAYLPGFAYHARRGRNLLLASAVARIPLLAWRPLTHLPTRPLYGFEWQVGYYVGTTWTTGNPFSQKNPIDAEFIFRPPLVISVQALKSPFLMSIGTGLTFRLMQLPIGIDTYWPIEEGRLGNLQFLVSLKKEI